MSGTQQEREILRQRLVGYLATRSTFKFDKAGIRRAFISRGLVDFEVSEADIEAALTFAQGLDLVAGEPDQMGATIYWQATSHGVLEAERKGWIL